MSKPVFRAVTVALVFALWVVVVALNAAPVRAADKTFTGPGNFSDSTKWDGGALPVAGDNLTIVGTVTFDNSASNLAYGSLTLGNGSAGTLNWPSGGTNTLNVTAISASVASSAIDMTNGGTLQIRTSWTTTNITFTRGTGTVNWNVTSGSSTLPAAITAYNNLTITATGQTTNLGVGTTVDGNLLVDSGTLTIPNYAITVTGTATINGTMTTTSNTGSKTFNGALVVNGTVSLGPTTLIVNGVTTVNGALTITSSTGTKTFNGDVTINDGGTWSETVAEVITYAGSLQNNGTYTASTGAHTFSGSSKTFSGTSAISVSSLDLDGTYTNNGTLTVTTTMSGAGTLTQGTNSTLNIGDSAIAPTLVTTASGNTVNWNRAGAQTLKAPSGGYYHLQLGGSGTKSSGAATTVLGNLTIDSGVTLDVTGGFDAWSVGGNWTNNGTFTERGGGTVTLDGASTQTINGSSTTSFYNMTISNTAAAISANSGFSVRGTLTVNSGGTLTPGASVVINSALTQGTITGSGTVKVTRTAATPDYSSQYKFTTNTLTSMTVEYAGAGDQTVNSSIATYGGLKTSGSGAKTLGTNVTVNGDLTIGSGTTLNTSASSNYSLTMKGGFTNSGAFTANGSTITINGTIGSPSIAGFSTTGPLNFLRTSGAVTLTSAVTAASLTINGSGGTLNLGSGLSHQINGTVTRTAGTLNLGSSTLSLTGDLTGTGATFTSSTGTVNFNGTSAQTIGTGGALSFYNLTINNDAGVEVNNPSGSTAVTGTFTLTAGVFTRTTTFIMASGSAISRSAGSISATPLFSGTVDLTYTGAASGVTTGPELPTSASALNNLTINKSGQTVTLGADATVNGTLTFTAGTITTSSYSLSIASGGSVSRTSGHVIGNLVKAINSNGSVSRTFEVGTGSDYTPVEVAISGVAGSGSSGQTLTASSTSGDHASLSSSGINSSKSVNRYWPLTKTGGWTFTSYNATFTFVDGDKDASVDTANFIVRKYSSGTWSRPPGGVTTGANSTAGNGFTAFSDYAIGEPPPWDSYQDSGRTIVRNTFNSGYTTVYMRGTGFASGTYNVAYYDAGASGGQKVATDASVSVAGDGVLDSLILLTSYPSAAAGTWHALVQPSSGYTGFGTDSYDTIVASPDTYGLFANDSFTVEASAIPEFSTVIGAVVVAGMCLGAYW